MRLFRMFVPVGNGMSIRPGDLFMVVNAKMPEYRVVFECSGLDEENRICKWNEPGGFHYLNVEKVSLFECSNEAEAGEPVFVSYDIRFPGLVTRQFYHGTVLESYDRKFWSIVNDQGVKVIAPKMYTYKKIREIDQKIARYGNRTITGRGLRAGASAGRSLFAGVGNRTPDAF